MTAKTTNKIAYLDGIRGMAALFVVLHHFCLVFYTAYFNWDANATHLNGWDIKYGKSAFSFLTNGNFYVCIFFVLSGFVLSHKYFNENKISILVSATIRRFFRLYIPVAFTLILAYTLLKLNLYYNTPVSKITHSEWWFGGMWSIEHPTKELFNCLTYSIMFQSNGTFDTSLWTMAVELINSFAIFAILAMTHKVRNKGFVMFVMIIYCYFIDNGYLGCFIFGICINYVEIYKINILKQFGICLIPFLFFLGILLGSYPTSGSAGSTIFAFHTPEWEHFGLTWFHEIGAFCLVASFVLSPSLQRFISRGVFKFLGRISFSLYLLHPLVIGTFSSFLFLHIFGSMGYHTAVLIVWLATIIVCFLLSYLMTKYIDDNGVKASKYIYNRYFKSKEVDNEG